MEKDNIKRYYEEWWENPSDPRTIVFERLNQIVKSRIPSGRNKRALDLGSGKGRIVEYLIEKKYNVTAVEFNEHFAKDLKRRFPGAEIICQDVRQFKPQKNYELTTCIELVQNLSNAETLQMLKRIRPATKQLFINISNSDSLHGRWVKWRMFQAKFVHGYSSKWLDDALTKAGFRITFRRGIGLLTPLTLWKGFKGCFIPVWLARTINMMFDSFFPNHCHLYYVEAE